MTGFLTANDILKKPRTVEERYIEALGGKVRVRRHSVADLEKIADFYTDAMDKKTGDVKYRPADYEALLIHISIVDEDGKTPLMTPEQIAEIRDSKDVDIWKELKAVCNEVNPKGTKDNLKKAKENLSETPGESPDSKSASPGANGNTKSGRN